MNVVALHLGGNGLPIAGAQVTRAEFVELVERHHADLIRLAFAMSGDTAVAEDAVQACWQAAWRSRAALRDPARIRGWLFTVTANEVRRQRRRDRIRAVLHGSLDPPTSPPQVDARHIDLATALMKVSVDDRELLAMRYGLGLTSEEIGAQLGISATGARRRLQRVLERMRKELEDD